MLIFDEKMMIFEAFLGPNIFRKRVFCTFFLVFLDLKIVRDISASNDMNGDFAEDFFCKKACFFLFMKKLVNAKIWKNACIFRVFLCFYVKKLKK